MFRLLSSGCCLSFILETRLAGWCRLVLLRFALVLLDLLRCLSLIFRRLFSLLTWLDLYQLGLDDEPLGVVREGAGLEGEDALAWRSISGSPIVGVGDKLLKDLVGVLRAVGVGQEYLVAVL